MVFCIKVQKLHGVYRSVNNHKYLNTTHISIRSSTSFSLWPFLCKTESERERFINSAGTRKKFLGRQVERFLALAI